MLRDLDELEEIEFEHAISSVGFGKFNVLLIVICGLTYAGTAVSVNIVGFVLPSAACDFKLTSASKGVTSALSIAGALFGSYFWGCMADTRGRKRILMITLLLDGTFGLISALVLNYYLFLVFRFLCGFSISGAIGICFAYLGEFHPIKYRETVLSWMEIFWTLGLIVLPLTAWAIIPSEFRFLDHLPYQSWHLFVAVASIPSLLLGSLMYYFPESPKFLVEVGESANALVVLKGMFTQNTGRDLIEFPIKSLRETTRKYDFLANHQTIRNLSIHKRKDVVILLKTFWGQTQELCSYPYRSNTVLTCFIQFGIFSSYYTLMLWFPDIFHHFEAFQENHPNSTVTVCKAMEDTAREGFERSCVLKERVYKASVMVGLACIPTSIWLPLCVNRLGAKFFLVLSLIVAGVSIILMNFTITTTQSEALACFFESMSSLAESAMYCVIVDLFPTRLRVMATCMALTVGRAGALIGSLMFGTLVEWNCFVPVGVFAVLLFASAVTTLFLPETGREALD